MAKKTFAELLVIGRQCPAAGSRWKHYKDPDTVYEVYGWAWDCEAGEPSVLYGAVGQPVFFVRLLSNWNGIVAKGTETVDGITHDIAGRRFTRQD